MYISSHLDKFKHIYDIERLKDYNNWCERDIKRLEELIEKIRKYQLELYEHAQHVLNTEMINVVTLVRRRQYDTNRVQYNVQLEIRPPIKQVENERAYGLRKHEKMFTGRERSFALKYAKELAIKYNCEIEKKGFPRS
ncbi:hypothetical protein [Bacillus pseudomycoides]|uniref:hypothetical protein n=1 Tax=Bacillus pseudomycoides TaxID=64104 RepID=UPI000BF1128F|nr:hypothetical protein [Bacillus pseudomycoides]PEK34079.1 hypothetical protein CN691_12725 [Bacillus pseudomycoides]